MSTLPVGENPYGEHAPSRLPAATRVGKVRLAVSELERSVAFYSGVIGLAVLGIEGRLARLGAQGSDEALMELEELPGVQPIGRRTRLGLYHTAILLPSREALSSFVRHLAAMDVPFGSADHFVSEALYLTDPDGLTVEVYADRARSKWRYEGKELLIGTEPLQFATLPAVADDSWKGAPKGTTVGHVHLYVGDLEVAAGFYHLGLGFDLMTWRYPGALFISAGGYHHHVGLNVWAAGSPVASAEDARMLFWELVFPAAAERDAAAERMMAAGYRRVDAVEGVCFADAWGIVVALVVG